MKPTRVRVDEITLSDNSKVYNVILDHFNGHVEFDMVDEKQADKFSGDLLEALRRNGFQV